MNPAIQDLYPDDFAHCYGCGRNNAEGHQLKSFVEGDEVVAHFTPSANHVAVPGFVYGGLLASLMDCHAMATAAAVKPHTTASTPTASFFITFFLTRAESG